MSRFNPRGGDADPNDNGGDRRGFASHLARMSVHAHPLSIVARHAAAVGAKAGRAAGYGEADTKKQHWATRYSLLHHVVRKAEKFSASSNDAAKRSINGVFGKHSVASRVMKATNLTRHAGGAHTEAVKAHKAAKAGGGGGGTGKGPGQNHSKSNGRFI